MSRGWRPSDDVAVRVREEMEAGRLRHPALCPSPQPVAVANMTIPRRPIEMRILRRMPTTELERTALPERVAILGSGAIACGLAALVAAHGPVVVLGRSRESCDRAKARIGALCERDGVLQPALTVTSELSALAGTTFVVEAIAEDMAAKQEVWRAVASRVPLDAVLATTTSSLSIEALARDSGCVDRFVGFHVFNPVKRMELVEVAFTDRVGGAIRLRVVALCNALGKTAIEVPDVPGFVVNRLLFPYLFDAVRLMARTGLDAEAIDACMRLGAAHPMGPLALLDLIGLDVSAKIGDAIGLDVPAAIRERVAAGALGRKSGRGFHTYEALPMAAGRP